MSDTYTPAQTADLNVARRGFSVSAKVTLTAADALVRLIDSGLSSRKVSAALKASGATWAPSHVTVMRYVNTRRALPADVTADAFADALKAATAAARDAGKRTAEPDADALTDAAASLTVTPVAGDLDALTDALAALFDTARVSLTGSDLSRFVSAASAEVAFTGGMVTIAA